MNLKRGQTGEEVKVLQEFLNSEGFEVGPPDGIFGAKTEIGLQRWQLARGLDADGIFGIDSLKKAEQKGFRFSRETFQTAGNRQPMKISQRGIDFIHSFETLRLDCYDDGFGYPTIGWGHLVKRGEPWKIGDRITRQLADELFEKDLKKYEDAVNALVRFPMTQGQYDACVSLAFNIGAGGFAGSSVLAHLNNGKIQSAAASFLKWNKVKGKPVKGLTRRREGEKRIFLS